MGQTKGIVCFQPLMLGGAISILPRIFCCYWSATWADAKSNDPPSISHRTKRKNHNSIPYRTSATNLRNDEFSELPRIGGICFLVPKKRVSRRPKNLQLATPTRHNHLMSSVIVAWKWKKQLVHAGHDCPWQFGKKGMITEKCFRYNVAIWMYHCVDSQCHWFCCCGHYQIITINPSYPWVTLPFSPAITIAKTKE